LMRPLATKSLMQKMVESAERSRISPQKTDDADE
jgi:hypothetical protein